MKLLLCIVFGVLVVGVKSRRLIDGRGYVRWAPGPLWYVLQRLAKRLPPEPEIRTGWELPRPPGRPEPEPPSTQRDDGMTTTGWDEPNPKERP